MDDCTTVFETLKGFLPMNFLEKAIDETGADRATKKFTVLRQLNTMMYAHLTQKEALRHITDTIATDKNLQEHTGIISPAQLSRRNNQRDPKIFEMMFKTVLARLPKHSRTNSIPGYWGIFKILDSTLMRLCLSDFRWACYRDTKAAVKMHTLFDLESGCPESIIVTEGIIHDKEKMKSFINTEGATYIFDRGYLDYKEFDRYCREGMFFITRLKKNVVMKTRCVNAVSPQSPVISDKEVILGTFYTKMQHPLRVIELTDSSTGEPLYLATNRFDLTAEEITDIYRLRWQIELFFKWIKQHLRIKRFYGTSLNAVQNQLYCALILFILLKLMHIKTGEKYDFLKLVRHIAGCPCNTVEELIKSLTVTKPPGLKRKRFNWKREYASLLALCLVNKYY